jgi:hypothetical protein
MENTSEENNLVQLFRELERQKKSKRDFVIPSAQIKTDTVTLEDGKQQIMMHIPTDTNTDKRFGITDHAHRQIAEKTKIPKNFYDRLNEDHQFHQRQNSRG